jgi:predicted PurR-regulated permease PerM
MTDTNPIADTDVPVSPREETDETEEMERRLPSWRWIWDVLWLTVLVVFLAMLAWNFLQAIKSLIVLLVISLFASFALEPAVGWLVAKGVRRGLATFLLLFGVGVAAVAMLALMVPLIVQQLQQLIQAAPGILEDVSGFTERWLHLELSVDKITQSLNSADQNLGQYASNVLGTLLGAGAAILTGLFHILTIGLFTFYFVADGPRFRRAVCSLLSPKRQRTMLWTWEVAIDKTGAYLYSRLLLAVFSGLSTFVVLRILGVPFAIPLSVWMGLVSQFIPTVGTYIAMSLPLLVAVTENTVDAVVLLGFFTFYQQIENYLIAPRVTARTMELHPALAFGAAIAGASVGGIAGALLALPAAAIVQSVVSSYLHRHEVMDTELTRDEPIDVPVVEGSETSLEAGRGRRPSLRSISDLFKRGA